MDSIILAGLDLDGNSEKAFIIVDEKIDFSFIAVIVIEQLAAVGDKLLRSCTLINRAKIVPRLIIEYRTNIAAVQHVGQKPHIVQIELKQIFADRPGKRKREIGNRVDDPNLSEKLISESLSEIRCAMHVYAYYGCYIHYL